MANTTMARQSRLRAPGAAMALRTGESIAAIRRVRCLGLNRAPGATLAYKLAADARQVSWVIRDGNTRVREIAGDAMRGGNTAGLHIVKWDLRVQPLTPLAPRPGAPAAGGGGGGGNNGPFVLPGSKTWFDTAKGLHDPALPKVIEEANAAGRKMPALVRDLIGAGVVGTPVT